MSSWFGGAANLTASLDSIKNQVSSSLREVFEEEEPSDPAAQLAVTRSKLEAVGQALEESKKEVARLEERNHELEEQKQAVEYQKDIQGKQFRELLKDKEEELKLMSSSFTPDDVRDPDHGGGQEQAQNLSAKEKVADLELQLRQEREEHQNEMMALQENLGGGGARGAGKNIVPKTKTGAELLEAWQKTGEEEEVGEEEGGAGGKEDLFRKAVALAEEAESKCHLLEEEAQGLGRRAKEMEGQLRKREAAETESRKIRDHGEEEKKALADERDDLKQQVMLFKEELDRHAKEKEEGLASHGTMVDNLRSNLRESESRNSELIRQVEALEEYCSTAKEEKEAAKSAAKAAAEDNGSLRKEVETLARDLEGEARGAARLQAENQDLRKAVEAANRYSSEHESLLGELRGKVGELQTSEDELERIKALLERRQEEMDSLRDSLGDRSQDVQRMTEETSVYKQQYEALLEEYNQYLEDLESLKDKTDSLERLKSILEEEVTSLKQMLEINKEEKEELAQEHKELVEKDRKREEGVTRLEKELEEAQTATFKERSKNRELEASLEEKQMQIEDLSGSQEQATLKEKLEEQSKLVNLLRMEKDIMQQELEKSFDRCMDAELDDVSDKEHLNQAQETISELKALLKEKEVLAEELKVSEKDIRMSSQKQAKLLDSLQEELDRVTEERNQLKQAIDMKSEEVKNILKEEDRMEEEIDDLKYTCQEQDESAKKELEEQKKLVALLRMEKDLVQHELEKSYEKCMDVELDDASDKEHLKQAQEKISELETSLKEKEAIIEELKASEKDVTKMEKKNVKLLDSLEEELHRVTEEKDHFKEAFAIKSEEVKNILKEEDRMEEEIDDLKYTCQEQDESSKKDMEELKRLVALLRMEKDLMQQELEKSYTKCIDAELDDASDKEHLKQAQEKISELEVLLKKKEVVVEELRASAKDMTESEAAQAKLLDSLQEELDRVTEERNLLKQAVDIKSEEVKNILKEEDRMEGEIDDLKYTTQEKDESAKEELEKQKKLMSLLRMEKDLMQQELEKSYEKCMGVELNDASDKDHLKQAQGKITELKTLLKEKEAHIDEFKSSQKELIVSGKKQAKLLDSLQEELERVTEERNRLKQAVDMKSEEVKNILKEEERMEIEIDDLKYTCQEHDESAKKRLTELKRLVALLRMEKDLMQQELEKSFNRCIDAELDDASDKEHLEQAEKRIVELEEKLSKMEAMHNGTKSLVTGLEAEKETLEKQLAKVVEKKHESDDGERKEIDEMEVVELRSALQEIREELVSKEVTISSLQDEVNSYKSEMEEGVSKLEDQNLQFRSVEEELERYKMEVSHTDARFHAHSEQLNALQEEMDTCIQQMEEERGAHEDRMADLAKAEKERERLEEELKRTRERLTEQLADKDRLVELVRSEGNIMKGELDQAMTRCVDMELRESESVGMEERVSELERERDGLRQRCMVAEEELERVREERGIIREKAHQDSEMPSWTEERSQVTDMLNEKTQENSKLKAENAKLIQDLAEERGRTEQTSKEQDLQKEEKEDMTKETVKRLSKLIRDKDLEITALQDRNESLVTLVKSQQNPSQGKKQEESSNDKESGEAGQLKMQLSTLGKEKQQLYEALTQKHQESLAYYSEIERLNRILVQQQQQQQLQHHAPTGSSADTVNVSEKSVIDNSNQIIVLKAKIRELEKKLEKQEGASQTQLSGSRRRYYSESVDVTSRKGEVGEEHGSGESHLGATAETRELENRLQEATVRVEAKDKVIRDKDKELLERHKELQEAQEQLVRSQEELRNFKRKADSLDLHQVDALRRIDELKFEAENSQLENKTLLEENQGLAGANSRLKISLEEKEHDLEMSRRNLQQLTEMLEEKSQTSESIQQERLQSLAAVQELQTSLSGLKRDGDELTLRLSERDRELAETRREVNNVIEKKRRLEQELDRLRQHLLAVEEGYTQEALVTEERERELRKKLQATEEALHVSTVQHSTSSQEATSQLQSLHTQVEQLQDQRDQLLKKLGRVSQDHQAQVVAVENLTLALEGFQRERDNELKLARKDYEEQLSEEEARCERASEDARALAEKLERANEGLEAAARLNEQLETKGKVIAALRQEMKVREELLRKAQGELNTASASGAGKVDRSLVKNLVVGYVAADDGKKKEVLKIVATVLDFNKEERLKTGLEGASNTSWLRGLFSPGHQHQQQLQRATGLDQSLAQAFIHFLEEESSPKKPTSQEQGTATTPKLPAAEMAEERARKMQEDAQQHSTSTSSSLRSSARTTPIPEGGSSTPTPPPATPGRSSPASARSNPLLFPGGGKHALPTFSANRSSSAILKSVLQEGAGTAAAAPTATATATASQRKD